MCQTWERKGNFQKLCDVYRNNFKQVFVIETIFQVRQQNQKCQKDLQDKQRPGTPLTASADEILATITYIITNDGRLII